MFNPCNPKYPLFTFAIALFVGGITNPSNAAEFKFPDQVDIYVKSLVGLKRSTRVESSIIVTE